MAAMVRRQVYVEPRHARFLKRRAKELGITEAALIRRGIERLASAPTDEPLDREAWAQEAELLRTRGLASPERELLTASQAGKLLEVSIPTIKRWVERGTLDGGPVGGRWLIAAESVERIRHIRQLFGEIEAEGYPTDEEIRVLYAHPRQAASR